MRVLACLFAIVLVVIAMTMVSAKNICPGKLSNGATPSLIPPATLTGMSNRGRGSYSIAISLCNSMAAPGSCATSGVTGYVAISNSSGCTATFDQALMRPTVSTGGFKVKFGSTATKKDMVEIMVLCSAFSQSNALTSRSKKFAAFSPNKLGGTTYLMVAHSHAACKGKNGPTLPPRPTRPHHSDMPSGGSMSSDMPSGGSMSSDMPSGGSGSSGMPPMPSSGSGSSGMPSGGSSSDMPSGGSGSSGMPSGGSGSMPFPSGGSSGSMPSGGSGSDSGIPSGGSSGYMPSSGSDDPISYSDSQNTGSAGPPIPSDIGPVPPGFPPGPFPGF